MNYLFTDIESTGLDPSRHGLVQIAAIPFINGVKREPFVSYVKPFAGAVYDPKALEINKLTFDQIQYFPPASEVIPKFIKWLDEQEALLSLAGQNIKFDRKFIYSWMCRSGFYGDFITRFRNNDICTLEMAKKAFHNKRNRPKSNKLGDLCEYFKIPLVNSHDALADIEATYELFTHLRAMMPETIKQEIKLSYSEKRAKYLHSSYVQFNPEGDIFINLKATKDPEAARFIAEEIYHIFGGI